MYVGKKLLGIGRGLQPRSAFLLHNVIYLGLCYNLALFTKSVTESIFLLKLQAFQKFVCTCLV